MLSIQNNVEVVPYKYASASWFLLLFIWMQGMALMHITLAICTVLSLPYFRQAFKKLKGLPFLMAAIASIEALRIVSSLLAEYPGEAFIGLFDDLRAIIFGMLALIHIRSKDDLKRAGWVSFFGFTTLAYWSLFQHLISHNWSLEPAIDVVFGTLAHVNYSAAYSSIVLIALLVTMALIPWKQGKFLLLGIIPLAMMQIPLGSRTTILVSVIVLIVLLLVFRLKKLIIYSISLVSIVAIALVILTSTGTSQFSALKNTGQLLDGHGGMPSLEIRWEIFKVISHLSMQHPFGLGPRNYGFVDLNKEREFLKEHLQVSCRYVYGFSTDSEAFNNFDFNHPQGPMSGPITYDPHSQYTATLGETGPLGLLLLLVMYFMLAKEVMKLLRPASSVLEKVLGGFGLVMLLIFILSGLTVVLLSQAGLIMLYLYIACLLMLDDLT